MVFYNFQNPACDLRSALALSLKRKILQELLNGCPSLASQPTERQRVLKEYKCYLESYTPEEIDWYGYTYEEAIKKMDAQLREENKALPHKIQFRLKLIEQLKQAGISEAAGAMEASDKPSTKDSSGGDADIEALTKLESPSSSSTPSNWLSKINPFGKKQET
uniref:Uncharacterized protein n=1 Tax=Stomoxys calcitrans TaxID=35570 RepID=A0A1I8Q4F1_STOCA